MKELLLRTGTMLASICIGAPTSWIIYETIKDPYARWVLSVAGFVGMAWMAWMVMREGARDENP